MAHENVNAWIADMEPGLDADELMHLALKAMNQDRDEDAMLYLKQALTMAPDDGRLHYLLGALHAELGMYVRAIAEITRAVALEPTLNTAHFQLGLLHLTQGNLDKAKTAWAPLDSLPGSDPLCHFKNGMTKFTQAHYEDAISTLQHGIALNTTNQTLNGNMARIIEQAQDMLDKTKTSQAASTAKASPPARAGKQPASESQHILLAGYRKQGDKLS